jgi:hypothetical protein
MQNCVSEANSFRLFTEELASRFAEPRLHAPAARPAPPLPHAADSLCHGGLDRPERPEQTYTGGGRPVVTISRVRADWSGWSGAPAVSTFYTAAPPTSAQLTAIRTLFFNLANLLPSSIHVQVQNSGQQIDTTTGKAVDSWSGAAQADVVGTGAGNYAAPVGALIRWNTGVFNNGKLLRGKTYLVPLVVGVYGSDGTIQDGNITTANTSIATFITSMAGGLAIYSRRFQTSVTATSGQIVDKVAVLRSRRA